MNVHASRSTSAELAQDGGGPCSAEEEVTEHVTGRARDITALIQQILLFEQRQIPFKKKKKEKKKGNPHTLILGCDIFLCHAESE